MPEPKRQSTVQPPPGYVLAPNATLPPGDEPTIPAFVQGGVDTSSVRQMVLPPQPTSTEYPGTETIAEAKPGEIDIYDPDKYDSFVQTHEETHEYQLSRTDGTVRVTRGYSLAPFGVTKAYAPEAYPAGDPRNYDYGGEDGLIAARNSGKTMADFNLEQQADIVAAYQQKQNAFLAKARSGKMTQADMVAMQKTHDAYHPLVQQLANVPSAAASTVPSMKTIVGVGRPEPLAAAPSAPGLPYGAAGLSVAPADPLLWGHSVPLKAGH